MILERQMTRRFCESRVMTEYHTRKPYFINAADDLDQVACSHSAAPSEDLFKKFHLYLTLPSSPPREDEDPTPQLVPASTDAALMPGIESMNDERFYDEFGFDFDCTKYTDDVTYDLTNIFCGCVNEHNLIKDCMWNGVGHKASAALRKAHNRKSSPSPCHPNGCVDPRNIFPYPAGQSTSCERKGSKPSSTNTARKTFRPIVDGAETPSDSEEEIDVVTVEKTQNNTILKPKNGPNAPQKIIATIIPKQNGKLALVTTSGASNGPQRLIKTITQNGETERGRARNKFHVFTTTTTSPTTTSGQAPRVVAMVTGKGTLNDQKVATTGLKRRHTAEENPKCCIVAKESPMQMANLKHVMQRGGSVSPVARFEKKRILSLNVSFCGSTGLQRNDKPNLVTPDAQNGNALKTTKDMAIGKFKFNKMQSPTAESMEIKTETDADTAEIQTQGSKSPQNKRKGKAESLARLMSTGSGSDSEQIRAAHNVLERQRREGLRASFHTLRDNVPELKKMEKTPKVNILNKASDYCRELLRKENNMIAEKERLNRCNQRLQERLERAEKSLLCIRPHDSDIESDIEESGNSPLSSLPPSIPPSPQVYAPSAYYIARRVASDNTNSPQEVVLRLEPPPSKKNAMGYPDYSVKPAKCQTEIRAFIAALQKTPEVSNSRVTLPHQDALSDGFECLDSDEDIFEAIY